MPRSDIIVLIQSENAIVDNIMILSELQIKIISVLIHPEYNQE